MAESYLVHERNLDPDLRAKINGIKTDDNQPLANMVTKQQLDNALAEINKQVAKSIDAVKKVIGDDYYSKADIITKDSLHIAYQDIDENKRQIDIINKLVKGTQDDLSDQIKTIVTKLIDDLGLSDNASDYTEIKQRVQNNADAINGNVMDINTNTSAIKLIQDDINTMKADAETYRTTDEKIEKADLSTDILNEFLERNDAINQLQRSKQDTLSLGVIGPVYREPGDITGSVDLIVRDAFCNSEEDLAAAFSRWRNNIYDVLNGKEYTWKEDYHLWNYSSSYDDVSHDENAEPATGYARYDIIGKYTVTDKNAVSIVDNHIEFTDVCTLRIGFYGSRFKLIGKMLASDETAADPEVRISVDDNPVVNELPYRYSAALGSESADNIVLLDATGLSLGRHTIAIDVPANCPISFATFIDSNPENAAVLDTSDMLIDFSNTHFDNQDNWEDMPSKYNIVKSDTLFLIGSLETEDVYNVDDFYVTNEQGDYNNRILYSTISGNMFIPSGGRFYTLAQNNGVTPGTITLFSGDTIPVGWLLCDGKNGTPRLTFADSDNVRYIIKE